MYISKQQFWIGVTILLSNYHSINRKLFACSIIKVTKVGKNIQKYKSNNEPDEEFSEAIDESFLISYLLQISKNDALSENIEEFVVQFKCIPKKYHNNIKAVGVIDILNCSYRMIFENNNILDFEIKLNGELSVKVLNEQKGFDFSSSLRWCNYLLKPKFYKWCLSEDYNSEVKFSSFNINTSLRLIDIEKYNWLYNSLKQKYAECAMKLWNDAKECTNPLKYIYEDLAIAAYLMTLWKSNLVNGPPTAFADLGCGNGLLVYILIQEGYQGYGYDIRSRKIWSLYPVQVVSYLYEQVIEPFKFNLPGEVDWLIGNHSDELSPWLPVLAATCHKNINFFLLPCCAFEFSGKKFQRRNSSTSCYKDFCEYAEKISNACGFRTEKDRLKIPSTKRNAIVGITCLYTDNDFFAKVEQVKKFVKNELLLHSNCCSAEEIKLREKSEAVKNCTQIEKSIIESLVKDIFLLLLEKGSNCRETKTDKANDWQTGGRLTLSEISKNLDREKLKQIKSECGGLKTLLRNKHEIFQFEQPDFVLIRKPQCQKNFVRKPQTVKKRACFFKVHHPQGCLLTDEECTFIH